MSRAFNPNTRKAEAGTSLSSKLACFVYQVHAHPRQLIETPRPSQQNKNKISPKNKETTHSGIKEGGEADN